MTNLVTELKVLDDDHKSLFDRGDEYIIPLYQRAYAWEDKQITQLVEDLSCITGDKNYYIGSLIVSEQNGKYEVVDGQQRLTTLYLLVNLLGLEVQNTLSFACRDKSNYTLENIKDLLKDDRSKLDMDKIEQGVYRGIGILSEAIDKNGIDREEFKQKLRSVVVYRIEVPENTDLNRYFEIMNTRGEQLEQHDILKAMLMGYLPQNEHNLFAKIWDACADMTGYVQMHFLSSNNKVRNSIFGAGWNERPSSDWKFYCENVETVDFDGDKHKIADIIDYDFKVEDDEGYLDDDIRVRFESVIEFPFFLLHTLKVFIEINGIQHEDGKTEIIAKQMDDKKLVSTFERVINSGVIGYTKLSEGEEKARFARDFVVCLLVTRFLFDKYIVKREYANENSDGEWSIKTLEMSSNKPYYKNTMFSNKGEWNQEQKNPSRVKGNIMLQSALRVSYTSPKEMHWITELLKWLSRDGYSNINKMADFHDVTEEIARNAVKENFFDECKDGSFAMGVNTPHIVFNYLDYLIWESDRKEYDNFNFEFRNSVEHWYPRNPSEGTFEQWEDGVDQFGNLCIIQRNVNSKFSNMAPEAKKSTFNEMIDKGSLKLRKMRDLTEKYGNIPASQHWRESAYKEHENEMIALLANACNVKTTVLFPDEEDEQTERIDVQKIGTTLNVPAIMLEWAKKKESEGELILDLNRCGKKFVRYTTEATSRILPEAETADSGWNTKTHYFYEIQNNQGRKLFMKIALSAENMPKNLREICNKINEVFPAKIQKENWKWRCPYISEKHRFDENTTKEDVINAIESCYAEMKAFETRLVASFDQAE